MKLKGELKLKRDRVLRRWFASDYPGGSERFQIKMLTKDVGLFLVLPLSAIVLYKGAEGVTLHSRISKGTTTVMQSSVGSERSSQIIRFVTKGIAGSQFERRAPGTVVRVRLTNSVESLEGASAHAQIIDASLGARFVGGTLVGDVTSDTSTGKIILTFHFARDPNNTRVAVPIAARAMSLDGTAGLDAKKKEGFFARSALRAGADSNTKPNSTSGDFKTLVAKAVAAGMMQEFQDDSAVQSKRAQVLTLEAGTEFFAELTDFFPANSR